MNPVTFADALATLQTVVSGLGYDVGVGDEFKEENASPPRIVIIPLDTSPAAFQKQGTVSRTITTETESFAAIIWGAANAGDAATGADYIATKAMRSRWIVAMRAAFGTSFKLDSGAWTSTEGESVEELGRKFAQRFTLATSVLEDQPLRVVISSTDENIGLADPGEDFIDVGPSGSPGPSPDPNG